MHATAGAVYPALHSVGGGSLALVADGFLLARPIVGSSRAGEEVEVDDASPPPSSSCDVPSGAELAAVLASDEPRDSIPYFDVDGVGGLRLNQRHRCGGPQLLERQRSIISVRRVTPLLTSP